MTTRGRGAWRPARAARAAVLAIAVAAGAASCTGGGGGGGDTGGDRPGTGGNADAADGAGGGDAATTRPVGVLDQFLAQLDSEPDQAQLARVEELTAQCMTEAGFEYIPVDIAAKQAAFEERTAEDDDLPPSGTREFAEQWGYGISTRLSPGATDASGASGGAEDAVGWTDPNLAVVAAMSESQQIAYDEALYGPDLPEPADPEAEQDPSWEQLGCYGAAQHEVYGEGFEDGARFEGLWDEIARVEEAVFADQRVVAADSAWSSCMADAGYPDLVHVADAETMVWDLVNSVGNSAEDAAAAEAAAAEDQSTDRSARAQFSDQEIEIALADVTCREQVGYDDVVTDVDLELQQQFYDEHRTELEEYAAFEESRY